MMMKISPSTVPTAGSVADLLELMMKAVDEPNNPLLCAQLEAAEKMFFGANLFTNDPKLAMPADKGAEHLMLECINDIDANMKHVLKTIGQLDSRLVDNLHQLQMIKDELEKFRTIEGVSTSELKVVFHRSSCYTILFVGSATCSMKATLLSTPTLDCAKSQNTNMLQGIIQE